MNRMWDKAEIQGISTCLYQHVVHCTWEVEGEEVDCYLSYINNQSGALQQGSDKETIVTNLLFAISPGIELGNYNHRVVDADDLGVAMIDISYFTSQGLQEVIVNVVDSEYETVYKL